MLLSPPQQYHQAATAWRVAGPVALPLGSSGRAPRATLPAVPTREVARCIIEYTSFVCCDTSAQCNVFAAMASPIDIWLEEIARPVCHVPWRLVGVCPRLLRWWWYRPPYAVLCSVLTATLCIGWLRVRRRFSRPPPERAECSWMFLAGKNVFYAAKLRQSMSTTQILSNVFDYFFFFATTLLMAAGSQQRGWNITSAAQQCR